jgi:putative selenate reductase
VCPNDANFVYETTPAAIEYSNYELLPEGELRAIPGGVLRIVKAHQLANFADACNECGNCDIFCPEDGGPQAAKPRFFGSLEMFQKYAGENGFFLDVKTGAIHGRIAGRSYVLRLNSLETQEVEVRLSDGQALSWKPKGDAAPNGRVLDMLPYLKLKLLAESVSDPRRVHFANVAGLQEVISGNGIND